MRGAARGERQQCFSKPYCCAYVVLQLGSSIGVV
jgi:hypothetical protein